MNPDNFEHKIKEVLSKTEYIPSEASWQKFQKALEESRKAEVVMPARRPMFVLLKRMGAVAAIIGVFSVSAYYLFNNINVDSNQSTNSQLAATQSAKSLGNVPLNKASQSVIEIADNAKINSKALDTGLNGRTRLGAVEQSSTSQNALDANAFTAALEFTPIFAENSLTGIETLSSSRKMEVSFSSIENLMPLAVANYEERQSRRGMMESVSSIYVADWTDEFYNSNTYKDPFDYAIIAKAGLPTVGKYTAGLGIKLTKALGKQFYFDAGIELTATDVQLKKALYYRYNDNGTFSNLGASGENNGVNGLSRAIGETSSKYSNNVMGISFAPMIGVKLKKIASIALGLDMSRNFNNSLVLRNNSFVDGTSLKQTVAPVKWVTMWDAGVRGEVAVKLNERLVALAQYRKGLVDYMMDSGGETVKNSSMQVGLSFALNP